jgi:hypothetical protein
VRRITVVGIDPPDGSVVAVTMKRSRGIYASLGIAVLCFADKVKVHLITGHEGPEVE